MNIYKTKHFIAYYESHSNNTDELNFCIQNDYSHCLYKLPSSLYKQTEVPGIMHTSFIQRPSKSTFTEDLQGLLTN